MSNIVGDAAPFESLVSLGMKPHPSIQEDKFTRDVKKIVRSPEVCIKCIKCMHVLQSESGRMKALALVNGGTENALFLFCPFTSEDQQKRARTGAELLVLEYVIPIKPDVDMQQHAGDRKRASIVEESEVCIYITVGSTQVLSLLIPYSVSLMEVLQKVKQAIHNSRYHIQDFAWLTRYSKLIETTFSDDVTRNSILDSNSVESNIYLPLIELEMSNSPPKGFLLDPNNSYLNQREAQGRSYTQGELNLTETEISFLEDPNAILKTTRYSRYSPSVRRRAKSRSESNLTRIPKEQIKKLKKQSEDRNQMTSSFSTFYTDLETALSTDCNGDKTPEEPSENKRSFQSDSDLRMVNSLSPSSGASNQHYPTTPPPKDLFELKAKAKSIFYLSPLESEKGASLEFGMFIKKSSSAENFDSEVVKDIEDSQYVEEGNQFDSYDKIMQTSEKRTGSDLIARQKSKKKLQAIGTAIRTIQDSWLPTHAHPEQQKYINKGPLQLADRDRRRMTASHRERVG